MRKLSSDAVLARLIEKMGATTDIELAKMLGTTSSTISTWKSRGRVPLAICERLAREKGWSLDWLLYGEGQSNSSPTDSPNPQTSREISRKEEMMLELFRSLNEEGQREIQAAAESKKRLADLEQVVEAMQLAMAKKFAA